RPVSPILLASGVRLRTAGVTDGQINVAVNTMDDLSATGALNIANLEAKGALIHGDRIHTEHFALNINQASRKMAGNTSALKLDVAVKAQDLLDVTAKVDAPQDALVQAIGLVGDVTKAAIEGKPTTRPASLAGNGSVEITANANLKNIAESLPKTLGLMDTVHIDSGSFAHKTTLTLSSNAVTIATNT